ncbi:MAG: hypothetical protein IV084_06005 [Rugosibacter sp.]|nr:hypothetical protein [Rugosibacter sp.]
MMNLLWFISTAPIAASMEEKKTPWRRLHPQGRNKVEDGSDAVIWSAASARNGKARGKKLRQAQRLPLRPSGDRTASFHQ